MEGNSIRDIPLHKLTITPFKIALAEYNEENNTNLSMEEFLRFLNYEEELVIAYSESYTRLQKIINRTRTQRAQRKAARKKQEKLNAKE